MSFSSVFSKLKAAFGGGAKKSSSSAVSAQVASGTSATPTAASDTPVDTHLFALNAVTNHHSQSHLYRASDALAAVAAVDPLQQTCAVSPLDGSVHIITHTGSSLRVVAPSGERVSLLHLLDNAPIVVVGRGRWLELLDFSDAADVKSVLKHQFFSEITALAFTADEAHLFVGLRSGHVHVVVVAQQGDAAPFYISAYVIHASDTHEECADEASRTVASRSRTPVLSIVPLAKATSPSLIIAYAESNVVVRFNVTSQKAERVYCKRDGVGEAALSCVAVHPNGDDVLCVHNDGQFVMYNDKRNAPVAWFSVRGNDGADIGVGATALVWTSAADDSHVVAVVRYDSDFKQSVVSVLRGERLDVLKVVGELAAPSHLSWLSLSLVATSPFDYQHTALALAARSDGKLVAVSLADGTAWQPHRLPALWHADRAPLAATQIADVCNVAMFVGDDAPESIDRAPLWPAAQPKRPLPSVDTAEPAVVLIAAHSDMCVSVYEMRTQQALFCADLPAELAKAVAEPPRLFGVADCCAVSRAGRPLFVVSCVSGAEESNERCVFLFATSAVPGAAATADAAPTIESDFSTFSCRGIVARGPNARIERCHDAAIAVSCELQVVVFELDGNGLLQRRAFTRSAESNNVALLSTDSIALLFPDASIVRVSNAVADATELRAAADSTASAPLKAFFALNPDGTARFYGEQDVPRFLSCAGRELRLTPPPWLLATSEMTEDERQWLGDGDDTVAQCNGLIRRAWLVRSTETLYVVCCTAKEELQVFRASDLAPCATLDLEALVRVDTKPVEVHFTVDGRGVVLNPLEMVPFSIWATDAATTSNSDAPTTVFVPNVPLPERKTGLLGSLFGTVKKNRAKASTLLSMPAAAPASAATGSATSATAVQAEAQSTIERMQQTKQRLLENQEKMQEVADKSADLSDQSANFANLAAQLNKDSKKSFFGF